VTIYIVTEGEYSDYHIEGTFSTEALAEGYIAAKGEKAGRSWDPGIEEWILDEDAGAEWRTQYRCALCPSDGGLLWEDENDALARPGKRSEDGWANEHAIVGTSYVSAEHAQKLAIEARQKWLRERTLTEEPAR